MATIDELKKARLEKLAEIKKSLLNPYPEKTKRTHQISEAIEVFDELVKSERR